MAISFGKFSTMTPDVLSGCFLAGGSVLGRLSHSAQISDFDLYPKSKEAAEDLIFQIMEDCGGFLLNISDRSITFKTNTVDPLNNAEKRRTVYQIILFDYFDTADKIFETFDFQHVMAAQDLDSGDVFVSEGFAPSAMSKRIHFNPKTRFPLASMARISKYCRKGYSIEPSQIMGAAMTCIGQIQQMKGWEDLEKAMGGFYGKNVSLRAEATNQEFSVEAAIEILTQRNGVDNFCYLDSASTPGMDVKQAEVVALLALSEKIPFVKSNGFTKVVFKHNEEFMTLSDKNHDPNDFVALKEKFVDWSDRVVEFTSVFRLGESPVIETTKDLRDHSKYQYDHKAAMYRLTIRCTLAEYLEFRPLQRQRIIEMGLKVLDVQKCESGNQNDTKLFKIVS